MLWLTPNEFRLCLGRISGLISFLGARLGINFMKHIATFIGLGLFFFSLVNSVPAHADCTPPPAGLVAWWNGEGNANDIIGTNNGVVDGTLGFASGEVGQAFQFTTTNADVKIPASASVDVGANDGFTLETWICPSNVVNLGPLFEWNDGAGNWGGALLHWSFGLRNALCQCC